MLVAKVIERQGKSRSWSYALDRAGIRRELSEFVLLVLCGAVVALAVGVLLSGFFLGLVFALLAVAGAVLFVSIKASNRKTRFGDQVEDLTQLLATNLRAGHSILQAMAALANDVDEPARSELARAVNQVRVGRDLGEALDETALRMDSDDFAWIAQAIAIHRQVGGNLADVLDTVGETIRDRGEIKRQVRALSAEGRMSAWVLMLLPIGVGFIIALINPLYFQTFTQSPIGWLMLATCAVLMLLGGLWIRNIVRVRF